MANVSHIGKVGEGQIWSSGVAEAEFMRDIPSAQHKSLSPKVNADLG
jgi:hypothetical protein